MYSRGYGVLLLYFVFSLGHYCIVDDSCVFLLLGRRCSVGGQDCDGIDVRVSHFWSWGNLVK